MNPARAAQAGVLVLLAAGLLAGSVPDLDHGLVVGMAAGTGVDAQGGVLAPGAAVPLDLTVSNPYGHAVTVTRLAVTVTGVSAPGVDGVRPCRPGDFRTSPGQVAPLRVAARSTTSLGQAAVPPERWPRLSMVSAVDNQDGCRSAVVSLGLRVWGRVG